MGWGAWQRKGNVGVPTSFPQGCSEPFLKASWWGISLIPTATTVFMPVTAILLKTINRQIDAFNRPNIPSPTQRPCVALPLSSDSCLIPLIPLGGAFDENHSCPHPQLQGRATWRVS